MAPPDRLSGVWTARRDGSFFPSTYWIFGRRNFAIYPHQGGGNGAGLHEVSFCGLGFRSLLSFFTKYAMELIASGDARSYPLSNPGFFPPVPPLEGGLLRQVLPFLSFLAVESFSFSPPSFLACSLFLVRFRFLVPFFFFCPATLPFSRTPVDPPPPPPHPRSPHPPLVSLFFFVTAALPTPRVCRGARTPRSSVLRAHRMESSSRLNYPSPAFPGLRSPGLVLSYVPTPPAFCVRPPPNSSFCYCFFTPSPIAG